MPDHTPSDAQPPPVVISIAGSDSSAGAGIQADLKTFSACGTYGLTALTCVVAEAPGDFRSCLPLPPELVRDQIEVGFAHFPISTIKIGALGNAEVADAVALALADKPVPIVVDPVTEATAGGSLGGEEVRRVLSEKLLPLARLVTPNIPEIAALLGTPAAESQGEMERSALDLAHRSGAAVLLKGGHLEGDEEVADVLTTGDGDLRWFRSPRRPGLQFHGTGCTLSSAIAAHLALGADLADAVERAKAFLASAMEGGHQWPSVSALAHHSPQSDG